MAAHGMPASPAMTIVFPNRTDAQLQGHRVMDIVLLGTGLLFFGISFAYIKFCSSI
jgi:hypothetical protein